MIFLQEKTVEPHLLHEFKEDFYGAKLKFVICGYLRPEMDFPSLEALIDAIKNDIAQSDAWLDQPDAKVRSLISVARFPLSNHRF